jgi:hypothetical protein
MDSVTIIETAPGTATRAKTGVVSAAVERLLRAIVPAANPDFDRCYGDVSKWWIELNPAGEPQRELGFNPRGEVVVAAPMGRDFGFFTDSNAVFEPADYPAVQQALFEAAWSEFESRWRER